MSILTQLNNLNITPDQLSELTKSGIIRIEKRLKAEVKFNEALSINEVEEVLSLLKNNKTELELLYDDYFNFFREIIESPNTLFTFRINISTDIEFTGEFKEFVSTYFEKSLELYAVNCVKESHYFALFSMLSYKDILSEYLLDFVLESLRKKVKLGFETLELKPRGPYDKIDYVTNPYFYRCITVTSALAVENDVIDLLNTIVNSNLLNDFYYKTLFAVGEFKSSRPETQKVIEGNKTVAIKKGVREKYYIKEEFPKKGGTVIESNKKNYTSSNTTSSKSYSSRNSFNGREQSRSSGTRILAKVLIGIVILYKIVTIIYALVYTDVSRSYKDDDSYKVKYNESNDSYDDDLEEVINSSDFKELIDEEQLEDEVTDSSDYTEIYEVEQLEDKEEEFESSVDLETVIIAPKSKPVQNYLKYTSSLALVEKNFSTVYNSIQYFQSSRIKVLKEISTDFEIEGTHFEKSNYPKDSKSKVVITNKNKNNIIALIKTNVGCLVKFIPSRGKCIVRQRVEGITLYGGRDPQLVTIHTSDGEIIKGFRFNDWPLENQQVFYRYTHVDQVKNQVLNLIINNECKIIRK